MTYSYFCLIVGTIFIIDGNTELQSFEHPTKVDGSLSILVVGNWGRKGSYNQSHVAYQFWGTITTRDGLAHLSPILKQRDTKWFCLKSYNLSTDITEFFFIDTTPFQGKYFTDPKDEVYDWRGMLPRENYLTILLKDLESTLRKSHAKWKIVIGHHTIRSGRIHGDSEVLVKRFLPILQPSSISYKCRWFEGMGGNYSWSFNEKDQMKFYYNGQGFVTMQITRNEVGIDFYDIVGNILHKWSISKSIYPPYR